MVLALDVITIGVPQVEAARAFYTAAFSTTATDSDHTVHLDLHNTGRLALGPIDVPASDTAAKTATTSFPGYLLSSIVNQPAEVKALIEAATTHGATVIKPPKKQFFGDFSAVYQAPDGTLWKVAATSKRDTEVVSGPPKPTETAIFLGVAKPKISKVFYEELGMSADRDYGDKFVDFTLTEGVCRLGLLPRKALAKDAGVEDRRSDVSPLILTHIADSRHEVDALLTAADSAGGRITATARHGDNGDYTGHFSDPDGYHWCITTSG
ncbi:VOC family protein [Nocardia grenadensis]